jgi:hypothetical protein
VAERPLALPPVEARESIAESYWLRLKSRELVDTIRGERDEK